ncbi:MAG: MBL fold metallo-hydrolase [Anaerolineae bacterium]
MTLEIKSYTLGIAATNAYIIGDTESRQAVVIDPVDRADLLLAAAQESDWEIKLILATHGHFDHVLASKALKDLTGAPFYIHEKGLFWLEQLPERGVMFTGKPFPEAATPDRLLTNARETLEIGAIKLETLYTPGHAEDHISYYMPEHNLVFGGDVLFAGSIGRTDLPGGSLDVLMSSIFDVLFPLGDDVQLLPGHMEITTLGQERRTNPWVLEYQDRQR